jgi:pyruvate kinase
MVAADGIMVARGDLGVELDPERVPLVQKDIITLCNARERPVITATQMLESMTKAARPTRAEVSDVANAIFDGTDAVMLSGETASGAHPVQALRMMARIAEAADEHLRQNPVHRRREMFSRPDSVHEAIGRAAELIARDLSVKVIVAATMDGSGALGISKSRPDAALLALTPDEATLRRMSLFWGVQPLRSPVFRERSELVRLAERVALTRGLAQAGDFLVLVTSSPVDSLGPPNNLRLHQIGARRTGDTVAMPRIQS